MIANRAESDLASPTLLPGGPQKKPLQILPKLNMKEPETIILKIPDSYNEEN